MSMFEVSSYVLMVTYIFAQTLYTLCFFIDFYLFSLPVNFVDMKEAKNLKKDEYPFIVLFYPVLRELEATMRTTFLSLNYPTDRYAVAAIPNADDEETVASLKRL